MKPSDSYINQDRATELLEKWAPILNFESEHVKEIDSDHTRLNTAVLLENQEKYLHENNMAQTGGVFGNHQPTAGPFSGDNYANGDARLPKIIIPMIRRTFPELISNEIVGVQPMGGPVGLAFAMRYRYEANSLGGNGVDGHGSLGPTTTGGNGQPRQNSGVEAGYQVLDTRFTGMSSDALTGNAAAGFDFVDNDSGVAALLNNFELTGNIPQMTISFEKTAVQAGTRRLAARFSPELEQDLKNMNGIDISAELTNVMSYELQAEIDREMIMRMVQVALNAGTGVGYSTWSPISADGRWLAERNRDLYAKVIVEANRIAVRNRRGAANFLVATPKVCAIFEMLPEFQWMQVQGNVNTQPVGIARVGNLGGRFNVYRDTRTEAQTMSNDSVLPGSPVRATEVNYVLLGYKGPEYYDTGIVYCPYVPIMVQQTIGPNDFAPRIGLLTRYGVVDNIFGAHLYYHVIIVKDLGTAFAPGLQSVYF